MPHWTLYMVACIHAVCGLCVHCIHILFVFRSSPLMDSGGNSITQQLVVMIEDTIKLLLPPWCPLTSVLTYCWSHTPHYRLHFYVLLNWHNADSIHHIRLHFNVLLIKFLVHCIIGLIEWLHAFVCTYLIHIIGAQYPMHYTWICVLS